MIKRSTNYKNCCYNGSIKPLNRGFIYREKKPETNWSTLRKRTKNQVDGEEATLLQAEVKI